MPQLGQRDFSAGWVPSDDEVQGSRNGLLRMDNLTLDERGVLRIAKGMQKVSQEFGATPLRVYSTYLGGSKIRYVKLNDGSIWRSVGGSSTFLQRVSGGHSDDFGVVTAYGNVILMSGTKKFRDNDNSLSSSPEDLEIFTPLAPTAQGQPNNSLNIAGSSNTLWTLLEGQNLTFPNSTDIQGTADPTSFRVSFRLVETIDMTAIQGGVPGTGSPNDVFTFNINTGNSANLSLIFIVVTLAGTPSGQAYSIAFTGNDPQIIPGINQWSTLQVTRGQFSNSIISSGIDWSDAIAVTISLTYSAQVTATLGEMNISVGGITAGGNLDGRYAYKQVNVVSEGAQYFQSPLSPASNEVEVNSSDVTVTPAPGVGAFGSPVTQSWIYRKNLNTQEDYYFLKEVFSSTQFVDDISDDDILLGVSDLPQLRFLIANQFHIHPPDNCIGIAGPYFDRLFYLTKSSIFVTPLFELGVVDSRYTLDPSSTTAETNLFLVRVDDSRLLLGTTHEIYEIAGTGASLPDGTIDFIIRPLGVGDPPISRQTTVYNQALIYMTTSGWKILSGARTEYIAGQRYLQYRDENRYGVEPTFIGQGNLVNYACTLRGETLYVSETLENGLNRRLYIRNMETGAWALWNIQPVDLETELDGTIIGCFGSGGDFFVRELDVGNTLDGLEGQPVVIRTPYLDDNTPNARKDVNAVKIYADTGDRSVKIDLFGDSGDVTDQLAGAINFNGPTLRTFAVTNCNRARNFQLRLEDTNRLLDFKFFYWTILYTERPELTSVIHASPTSYGTAGRKRFYGVAWEINELFATYTATPVIDGIERTELEETFTGSVDEKVSQRITFESPEIGHEIGLKIVCAGIGLIEWYGITQPRNVEVLPDLQQFLHIPNTTFGSPTRKRFRAYAFSINTFGNDVLFTPILDNAPGNSSTVNTNGKQLYIHYFTTKVEAFEIGGELDGNSDFEFWGIETDQSSFDVLPPSAKRFTGSTDFGTAARKRFARISFEINPRGGVVTFTPILDGIAFTPITYTGNRQQTFSYHSNLDLTFVDLDYILESSVEFEFYQILRPEILELLPEPVLFLHIPVNNQGTRSEKQWANLFIEIDTRGVDCTYTPILDGVSLSPFTINTSRRETVPIHFVPNITGIDLGGTLLSALPFEFYGIHIDETLVEVLPPKAKYLQTPYTNFGVPAKKRVRTLAFELRGSGINVFKLIGLEDSDDPNELEPRQPGIDFTPLVDGGAAGLSTEIQVQDNKTTLYYFFETDIFGTDFGAIIDGLGEEFRFYGFVQPEIVEVLPAPKKFDQLGPYIFDIRAWVKDFTVMLIPEGSSMTYRVFVEDEEIESGLFETVPNVEKQYTVIIGRGAKGSNVRIELQSSDQFHRISGEIRYGPSGANTNLQKVQF